jgi:hypothetical protein
MKYLCLGLLLCGCAVKDPNATIFLKEYNMRLYNLNGEDCIETGYQLVKSIDGTDSYRLITFYSNCSVHKEHLLDEIEIKAWKPEVPKITPR